MPRGELAPVIIITLPLTLLCGHRTSVNHVRPITVVWGTSTHGPAESGAMRRILGMFSKVPGSTGLVTSCSLRASSLLFGAADMMILLTEEINLEVHKDR
jgi:hypothetical protein